MQPFQKALVTLLKECFEGIPAGASGTWFVEGKEGIFDALATVTPEKASVKPADGSPTIAAHVYHVLFALQNGNSNIGRPAPEGTWESSWERQTVDEAEWERLKSVVRDEYEFMMDFMALNEDWSNADMATGCLGQLAHMGYHLGAIRALMKVV